MELSGRQVAFLALARGLLRLDRSVHEVIDRVVAAELGLRARQVFVLAALERGVRHPGAVARRLNLPAPSVTRTVEGLVTAGHVTRRRSSGDRRRVELALTDRGQALLARARGTLSQGLADAWPHLDTARVADLADGLSEMVDAREGPVG